MAQWLNHLGEYGGCLAPRDNQDFDPYVSPLRSRIHRCDCVRGGKTILQSIGVFDFLFYLTKLFYKHFFCFCSIFSKRHAAHTVGTMVGTQPRLTNQPWRVIHFLHPNLISISFTAHPLWIHEAHEAQVDSNRQKKNRNYFWKGRGKKGGGGFLFLQKLSVSVAVDAQWSAQWSTPLPRSCKSPASQSVTW